MDLRQGHATMSARNRGLLTLAVDVGVPIGLYYLLRAADVGAYAALLICSFVPGLSVVSDLVRRRRPDRIGVFMTTMMLTGAAVASLIHDPRLLLAKDGWFMAAGGLWFLVSVRGDRPLAFLFTRLMIEGRLGPRESWDVLWDRLPRFRRIWRVATVIYGVGLIIDALVRVVMAHTLPIDVVPGLSAVQYAVWLVLMQVALNLYLVPSGVYNPHSRLYADLRHAG
ncbi:hypothetical protein FE391_31685 [Nonomuraea sp. KC401]|uniref:VC0807 family protein n=1 Tax=unclassified Nonomuraea TaxID=2593643 RepID=UPI0010FF49AD|nr:MULTISPECIES: VC0807 family protein [unclassified Nonomuraea]NBE98184.1 hypothetical protein [Nonomuraea sp. K271]TLF61731.1 hypothetical protein FE391_31685 [Nonomuraea sp. KC401]